MQNAGVAYSFNRSYLYTVLKSTEEFVRIVFNQESRKDSEVIVVLRGNTNIDQFQKGLPHAAFDPHACIVCGYVIPVVYMNEVQLAVSSLKMKGGKKS